MKHKMREIIQQWYPPVNKLNTKIVVKDVRLLTNSDK